MALSRILVSIFVGLIALSIALYGILRNPIARRLEIMGYSRPLEKLQLIHGSGLERISGTLNCEDIHYHEPSGLIFGVAERDGDSRKEWFPPIANFKNPGAIGKKGKIGKGKIFVLDPETKERTDLELTNFE